MNTHTPGPWKRDAYRVWHTNDKGENRSIADCQPDNGHGPYRINDENTAVANANLCASAPDLLAALQGLLHGSRKVTSLDDWTAEREEASLAARFAIAKATGAEPQKARDGAKFVDAT